MSENKWMPHTEWAEKMGFKNPEGEIDYTLALRLCSENTDYKRYPMMIDRRDVLQVNRKSYQVLYSPWNASGQRYPRTVNRKQWLLKSGKLQETKRKAVA